MGARLFRLCSVIFVAVYGRLPVFGELRSSVSVIEREGRLLLLERSDELGLGFPGGIGWWWESDEALLRRELREETGLEVAAFEFWFSYHDRHFLPSEIKVFKVQAAGALRSSWEGVPVWVTPEEARARIFPSHEEIARRYLSDRA